MKKKVIWSPSSWALWKKCPESYRLGKLERWSDPYRKKDHSLAKLAVPGLTVDKILQYWFHRNDPDDLEFFNHENFSMFWEAVIYRQRPYWSSDDELKLIFEESWQGLQNAVNLIRSLDLHQYDTYPQVWFHERLSDTVEITGAPDLMLRHKGSGECMIIDFKNSHSRNNRLTAEPLYMYLMGLEKSLGEQFSKLSYCYFNPRINGWHHYRVYESKKKALIKKLEIATNQVLEREFKTKYIEFSCSRFCSVRWSCPTYQSIHTKQTA